MSSAQTIEREDLLRQMSCLPIEDVYQVLGSKAEGLQSESAILRLKEYGANILSEIKHRPLIFKFFANFSHVMAILLWVGGFVAIFAGMPQLAIAIWMVNLINGSFSFWQEYRAEKATEALKRLLPIQVRLIRDGQEQVISAEALVPGDLILIEEGDRISADSRLIQASELLVDQSSLTGESIPVRKLADPVLGENLAVAEIPNLIFAGSHIVSGTGRALVFATGMHSEFGKIANLTQTMDEAPSPLQKEMAVVTRVVTLIAVGLGLVFFILSVFAAGMTLADSFIFALGMIVAFVPEGLLPTVTLALAMGVQRMAKRNALIKKLSSVETLGCTTVICTDKTGTLTQNAMTVTAICLGTKRLEVVGNGYLPVGDINAVDKTLIHQGDLSELLIAAGLCNNARLVSPSSDTGQWRILGDPTEAALLVAASKASLNLEQISQSRPRLRELPFDSRRKRMSTLHHILENNHYLAYVKGAPNEILALCNMIQIEGERIPLSDNLRAEIRLINDSYAKNGLRVLAVAMRDLPNPERHSTIMSSYNVELVENQLVFLGLMAMMDPPRPEVLDAVKKCHQAGIRIIMITGDYGLTAESIAQKIGIVERDKPRIVTGPELDKLSDKELHEILKSEVIFARVAPEHKLRVVAELQTMGHIVAVTGDGVNDAPALKKADIGVAMGLTGTDVAKEAADLVLADDNFASIVNAIEEGRGVYSNIKKFTTYIFTSNTPEAVPFVLFAFSGGRIPLALNIMQILAIDLGTDMMPALGLGAEAPEAGIMLQAPRQRNEHLITIPLLLRAYLWLGPVQSLAAMIAFYFMYWTSGYAWQFMDLPNTGPLYASATAMAFAAVVATQIGNVLTQRTEFRSIFGLKLFGNRLIWLGILSELVLVFLIVYTPAMNYFIGTNSFPLAYWLFLLAWIPSLILVDEIRKWLLRRRMAKKEVVI